MYGRLEEPNAGWGDLSTPPDYIKILEIRIQNRHPFRTRPILDTRLLVNFLFLTIKAKFIPKSRLLNLDNLWRKGNLGIGH